MSNHSNISTETLRKSFDLHNVLHNFQQRELMDGSTTQLKDSCQRTQLCSSVHHSENETANSCGNSREMADNKCFDSVKSIIQRDLHDLQVNYHREQTTRLPAIDIRNKLVIDTMIHHRSASRVNALPPKIATVDPCSDQRALECHELESADKKCADDDLIRSICQPIHLM